MVWFLIMWTKTTATIPILSLILLIGCNEPMEPVSTISKFRIMAIQADPPEIRPGEGTTHRVLFADPEGDGREVTLLWITILAELTPSSEITDDVIEKVIDFQVGTAAEGDDVYQVAPVDKDVLDDLEEDETYKLATTVLSLCAGGELPNEDEIDEMTGFENLNDLCKGGEGLVAFKTFRISKVDDNNRNTNPELFKVSFNGNVLRDENEQPHSLSTALSEETPPTFTCNTTAKCLDGAKIDAQMTESSFETFEQEVLDEMEIREDAPFISWFVSGGELDETHSRTASPPGPFKNNWVPPLDGGTFTLWVVAHDIRGGTSWKQYTIGAETHLDH
jgi:hypothetical protein